MNMKKSLYILSTVLILVVSGQAFAEKVHHKMLSGDCTRYTGTQSALPRGDAQFMRSAIEMFRTNNRQGLLGILDDNDKLQFTRRFVSGGSDARGGNIVDRLKPQQIDKNLWLHVEGNQSDAQVLKDFSAEQFPEIGGTGVFIGRNICDGVKYCDVVPYFDEVEHLIDGVLRCNHDKNAAFVFTDGILLTNMARVEGVGLPMGSALFFSKRPAGYRLTSFMVFQ